jgi:protein phosphatase
MTSVADERPEAPLQLASKTDVGRVRQANEDSCESFGRDDGTRLLVVADGMGGHRGGATASRTTVEIFREAFEARGSDAAARLLEGAVRTANARVYEMAQADPALEGMGTTVVAFHLDARGRGTVAHVGDSRAYRYRRGHLEALTTDHSVVAEMQRRGLITPDEAAAHPRRNEILRSVGVLPEVDVDITDVEVLPGDQFVLCSDGLSGVVSDRQVAAIVQQEAPSDAVEALVRLANELGGPDNVTVQILAIPTDSSQGDPEATAPVEISEVGIEAIEARRRRHKRRREIAAIATLLLALIAGYLLWTRAFEESERPAATLRPGASPPPGEGIGPNSGGRPRVAPSPPRKGIPRGPADS